MVYNSTPKQKKIQKIYKNSKKLIKNLYYIYNYIFYIYLFIYFSLFTCYHIQKIILALVNEKGTHHWKAGTHTELWNFGRWLLYIYTYMTGDQIVYELLPNCSPLTTRNFNWSKTRIDHVMLWWGGGNYMFEWELLKFGWNLDEVWMVSSKYICLFVCLFLVACFECFLSCFLSFL